MKAEFSVVPPGGGKNLYSFTFEMPSLPTVGDCIFKRDCEDAPGAAVWSAFIVRRRKFWPDQKSEDGNILIEVEPARYYLESAKHKRMCDDYAAGGKLQTIPGL